MQVRRDQTQQSSLENATLAEIGRIVASSLDINEFYDALAKQVRKLIKFERMLVSQIEVDSGNNLKIYFTGTDVPTLLQPLEGVPLSGTMTEEVARTGGALLVQAEQRADLEARFPGLPPTLDLGMRSFLSAPLISKQRVIGALHLRSVENNAYSQRDVALAERIGLQISDAVANTSLHAALEREAREREVLAEIGRTVSSSLDVDDVYDSVAEAVGRLIQFDRMALTTIDDGVVTGRYVSGIEVSGRRVGSMAEISESLRQVLVTRSGMLVQSVSEKGVHSRYSNFVPNYDAGLRSFIIVPLVAEGRVVAVLHIQSTKPHAYDNRHLLTAERIATQMANAVAAADLHLRLKHEANEREVLAEIGRIISSSLDISEAYERFADQVRRLIHFDRIVICDIDADRSVFTARYVQGINVPGMETGEPRALQHGLAARVVQSPSGLVMSFDNVEEAEAEFTNIVYWYRAGIRSAVGVPLVSRGDAIGVLYLTSTMPKAYDDDTLELANRVGNQIAGAVARTQLYAERERNTEELRKAHDELEARVGDTITYIVALVNNGLDTATNVEINDFLPVGLSFTGASASQGVYIGATGSWTVGSLPNGSGAFLNLDAVVTALAAGQVITNTAAVGASDQVDPDPTNDSDSVLISVQLPIDIDLAKTVSDPAPFEGDSITFTVTVTNNGPGVATGLVVTDALPAGFTVTGTTILGDSLGVALIGGLGGPIFADGMPLGYTFDVAIDGTIDAGTAGTTLTNSVSVTALDQIDTVASNDTASADVNVPVEFADIALAKAVSDATPLEGDSITFTITITNNGPFAATGLVVTDVLPAGFTVTATTILGDSLGVALVGGLGGPVFADGMPSGYTFDVAVDGTIDAGTAGTTLTNSVSVTALDQVDSSASNDNASVNVNVEAFGSISGQKFHDLNGNAVHDGGEPGLDGWVIEVRDSGSGALMSTAMTASVDVDNNGIIDPETEQGLYELQGVRTGTYDVGEVLQSGWTQTFPVTGKHTISLASGQQLTGADFGNSNTPPPVVISVSEDITVLDAPLALPPLELNISEVITVVDAPDPLLGPPPLVITVSESVTVNDSLNVVPPVVLFITESVTVVDAPVVLPALVINISEAIIVADTPDLLLPLVITISESITVNDAPNVVPPVVLVITENLIVADTPLVLPALEINISEVISVVDAPDTLLGPPPLVVIVSESITMSDAPIVVPPVVVFVSENVTVLDLSGSEICDGIDNDGDGQIDEGFLDTDGDGQADCVDPDDDNDGIHDEIDGRMASDNFVDESLVDSTNFTDVHLGGTTAGSIISAGALEPSITDLPNPDGVFVDTGTAGPGPVTIDACGLPLTHPAGTTASLTCGSLTVGVAVGPVTVALGSGGVAVVPDGTTATFTDNDDGTFTVENDPTSAGAVEIVFAGEAITVAPGETQHLQSGPQPVSLADFVLLGVRETRLDSRSVIVSGDVGVVGADENSDKRDREIELRVGWRSVALSPDSLYIADTIKITNHGSVQNIAYNELKAGRKASINGEEFSPIDLPLLSLPDLPEFDPGHEDIQVRSRRVRLLAPGGYGKVDVKSRATLVLTGGLYEFEKLTINSKAKLLVEAATEIRVKGDVEMSSSVQVGPAADTTVGASDIVFLVAGNKFTVGSRSVIHANVLAPEATLSLLSRVEAVGAFVGKKVRLGYRASVTLDSAF